jgi:PAS domain S-box-containing protein
VSHGIVVLTDTSTHELVDLLSAEAIDVVEHGTTKTIGQLLAREPAIVVVDVGTLGAGGLQWIATLVAHDELRHTLTLALTEPDRQHIEDALGSGADDFLTLDQLAHVSTRLRLEHYRNHASAPSRVSAAGAPTPPSERPPGSSDVASLRHTAGRRIKRLQPYVDFFKNSADGMVVMDRDGRILFANPQARTIFPIRNPTEVVNVFDFITPSDHARAHEIAEGFSQGRFPRNVDFQVRIPAEPTGTGPAGARNAVISVNFSKTLRSEGAVLFTFRDVTKERATELELTQAREFLERVIDSSLDAIVAADLAGNVRLFNRAASLIFGYARSEVVGVMKVERLYPEGVARDLMKKIRAQDHGGYGRLEAYAVNMLDASGNEIPVRLSAGLIYEHGKPWGSVGVFRDVREERRLAARLEEAEAAVRDHEKGVAVAQLAGATAHELNQPLTVMIAYADMLRLKLGPDSPLAATVEVLAQQAERMAEIVRQVGRITRFETKSYVGSAQILDLEKSSRPDSER